LSQLLSEPEVAQRLDGRFTIPLLLTPNGRYAQHAAACIASLLEHTRAALDVMIASTEDPANFAERLRRSFAGNDRVRFTFRHFEVPSDFPVVNKLTRDAYLRFWVGELMPGHDRILYLDPDIIAVGSIDELWATDLRGKVLGAVPIPGSVRPKQHGMPPGSPFFNSGVVLFDLAAWRARDCRDRCIDYLRAHPERALDADQDILNLVLIGDWLPLPYKWNVINPFYRPSHDLGLAPEEVANVLRDARLVHFNGSRKPWIYMDNHPRKADYFRALAHTDWRGWQPPDRTPLNIVRKHASRIAPVWVKSAVRAIIQRGS
jgi:lipopolysaccharide biosynthesis glycosyltransferase